MIRPASSTDLPAIREVLVTTWHATYDAIFGADEVTDITSRWHSLENLTRQLAEAEAAPERHAFLVAQRAGRILGTISVSLDAGAADLVHLSRLYILPEAQGSGLGRALLGAAMACFPAARRIDLEVEPSNAPAIAFYRRFGFETVARASGCGGDAAAGLSHLVMAAPVPLLTPRPARDSDAQDLFGLLALCFAEYPGCFVDPHGDLPDLVRPGHWPERRGADGRQLRGEFLVVEDKSGRVSACIAYDFPEAGVAELHRLYVRPDARTGGVAASLVARIEARAREAGAGRIILWSDTRFVQAHRLYRRLGYEGGTTTRPLGDISGSIEYRFDKALV